MAVPAGLDKYSKNKGLWQSGKDFRPTEFHSFLGTLSYRSATGAVLAHAVEPSSAMVAGSIAIIDTIASLKRPFKLPSGDLIFAKTRRAPSLLGGARRMSLLRCVRPDQSEARQLAVQEGPTQARHATRRPGRALIWCVGVRCQCGRCTAQWLSTCNRTPAQLVVFPAWRQVEVRQYHIR